MSGEGFLSRWARRKQEVSREDLREHAAAPAADIPPVVVEAIEPHDSALHDSELHDPEAITPEELAALPPVEEVVNPADFSQYLRKGVPAILRNAAMRRMWMLDPAIRDYVDPALDYAYDWNVPGGVPGNGPLAAGFDAKGAAEKFFSKMRGKISNETGEWEDAQQEVPPLDGDKLTHKNDATEASAVVVAVQQNDDADSTEEHYPARNASDPTEVPATFVVECGSEIPKDGTEALIKQGAPRRHGRALPV